MSTLIKKHFLKLFTSDIKVLKIGNDCLLEILKNGSTSYTKFAEENKLSFLKNNQIEDIELINVFLRTPTERFASGVNAYCFFNNKTLNRDLLNDIESFKIVDKHFVPQIFYLFHLFKFYKNKVRLQPIENLKNYMPNHDKPQYDHTDYNDRKKFILSIEYKKYIEDDEILIKKYLNKTIKLEKLIEDFRYVLS